MSVVVASNRVARARPDEPIAGGLVAALLPAVKDFGVIWVGSSGRLRNVSGKDAFAQISAFGNGALATVDLPQDHYCGYYDGFANSALWPALHSRADLIRALPDHYVCFSNRPFGVKRFQTIHHCSVDVAHGLALLL